MNESDDDEIDAAFASVQARRAQTPPADELAGPSPVDWRHLSASQSREAWSALREWVEWFTRRYNMPVSVIPPCWWKHGTLVEELAALHTAHLVAFDRADSGYGPLGWHERLAAAQSRLQRAGSGCVSKHNDDRRRSWEGQTDEAEWDAWIDQNHAG